MKTTVIDNFNGRLTRQNEGDINSGFAKFSTSFGYEPFSNPGNLTWADSPIQIDAAGSVIDDLIVAGKGRVESGVLYIYAVGHTGNVYKIQVNDPTTKEPDYDTPTLLTTLTVDSPTFTRGGSIEFYGATERIYIGSDVGVTQLDFDGTNEAMVGTSATYVQDVPRPLKLFRDDLIFGNGSNIGIINTGLVVETYEKLEPAFPRNSQVRDMDISPDTNYLDIVVSRLALPDITSISVDTSKTSNSESIMAQWNGTDLGSTAGATYPSFSLNSNINFGTRQYVFGYDIAGAAVFMPTEKILSPVLSQAPLPNAVGSNGNIVGWATSEFSGGFTKAVNYLHGPLDVEFEPHSWYRPFNMAAASPETDVLRVPYQAIVSNFSIGSVTSGYAGGVFGSGKMYFSTLESSAAPTTAYRFYKFHSVPDSGGTPQAGVYETQNKIFSKKQTIKQVRLYVEPLVANNEFDVELIGSSGNPITNSKQTFTVGTNADVGQDYLWYDPAIENTYTVGLRITNSGSANWTLSKAEIDYEPAGI